MTSRRWSTSFRVWFLPWRWPRPAVPGCDSVSRASRVIPRSARSARATGPGLPLDSRRSITAHSEERATAGFGRDFPRFPPSPALA